VRPPEVNDTPPSDRRAARLSHGGDATPDPKFIPSLSSTDKRLFAYINKYTYVISRL
jgi:hypothetical protein